MRRCWCCCCWWKRQRLISTLLAVAQALLSIGSVVDARLKAAVILPHGDFAFDPSLVPVADSAARDAAEAIAAAARSVGQWLGSSSSSVTSSSSVDPDLIFLSTPHGVSMSNDFAVYLNAAASGTVEIGADLHQNSSSSYYTVTLPPIPLAPILAQELVNQLTTVLQQHQNVTGVEIPGGDTPLLLQWAEVIPLLLIARRQPLESKQSVQSLLRQTTTTTIVNKNPLTSSDNNTPRQHLIWTHPLRRYTTAPAMVTELLHLGDWLGTWLDALPINVAVVISGDLSHTHESTGPYGYSATAALMDAALGSWAADPCANADDLLVTAAALQNRALSCGFTGFVLLHGILCGGGDGGNRRGGDSSNNNRPEWNSQVLVNRNVTYYGMMVARYTKIARLTGLPLSGKR